MSNQLRSELFITLAGNTFKFTNLGSGYDGASAETLIDPEYLWLIHEQSQRDHSIWLYRGIVSEMGLRRFADFAGYELPDHS